MIGSVPASRRANAFAQALDEQNTADGATGRGEGAAPPRREGAADDTEQALLLAVAGSLKTVPRPELDPEVKAVQRARLIAEMETAFAESGARGLIPGQRTAQSATGTHRGSRPGPVRKFRPRSRLRRGIAAGGLTVGVAAGAFTGVAAASTNALPGDSLYGLKRGMEDLKLGMAGSDIERGKVHLDHASTRLQEARRLMERQQAGALDEDSLLEVRNALSGMRKDASEAHRLLSKAYARDGSPAPIRSLSAFSQRHRELWGQLRTQLPPQLTDVGDQVSSVLSAIDSDVSTGRPVRPSRPDAEVTDEDGPGTPGGPVGPSGTLRPPVLSDAAPSAGSERRTDRGSGSGSGTSSSPASPAPQDGLLSGGGLLEPPFAEPSEGPSEFSSDGPEAETEVTIPPLLREILPRLGIDRGAS